MEVDARTTPGINRPGGVGKITKLHYDNGYVIWVDVKYVLSGSDKQLDLAFVHPVETLERASRTRRSRDFFRAGPARGGRRNRGGETEDGNDNNAAADDVDDGMEADPEQQNSRSRRRSRTRKRTNPVVTEETSHVEEDRPEDAVDEGREEKEGQGDEKHGGVPDDDIRPDDDVVEPRKRKKKTKKDSKTTLKQNQSARPQRAVLAPRSDQKDDNRVSKKKKTTNTSSNGKRAAHGVANPKELSRKKRKKEGALLSGTAASGPPVPKSIRVDNHAGVVVSPLVGPDVGMSSTSTGIHEPARSLWKSEVKKRARRALKSEVLQTMARKLQRKYIPAVGSNGATGLVPCDEEDGVDGHERAYRTPSPSKPSRDEARKTMAHDGKENIFPDKAPNEADQSQKSNNKKDVAGPAAAAAKGGETASPIQSKSNQGTTSQDCRQTATSSTNAIKGSQQASTEAKQDSINERQVCWDFLVGGGDGVWISDFARVSLDNRRLTSVTYTCICMYVCSSSSLLLTRSQTNIHTHTHTHTHTCAFRQVEIVTKLLSKLFARSDGSIEEAELKQNLPDGLTNDHVDKCLNKLASTDKIMISDGCIYQI